MGGLFNLDNPVMVFLRKVADLLIVNLLWMVCSIPIITIGASTTAMYYVCFKIVNGDEPYICKSFFKSFKENFKQSTIIWLLFLVAVVFLAFDIYSVTSMSLYGSTMGTVLLCIFVFTAIVVVSMFIYVFALQSRFENTIKNTLKNAAIFGLSYYGYTMVMVVVDVVFTFLGLILCPFVIPVLPIWFNTMFMRKIFAKYIPDEEEIAA